MIFESFFVAELRKKREKKISQIYLIGFQFVAKNIKRRSDICVSYLIYSQIWVNLLDDDHHFFCVLPNLLVKFRKRQMK